MKTLVAIIVCLRCFVIAEQPKVAIIGAGIGGTSVAHYLSEQIKSALDVTIIDSGVVGGRLATTVIAGREYETGGSIIHPANRLMEEHLVRCNFKKSKSHEDGPFSLISNDQIIFQASDGIIGSIKSVLRYGLFSLMKLDYFVGNLLDNFGSIYGKLDAGHGYESVASLLDAMSPVSKFGDNSHEMLALTKMTTEKKLQQLAISEELINEIGMVASKVNYGQFPDTLHGFVGSVSLAGIQGGLWNVEGGNYRIPQCLLDKSGAKLKQASAKLILNTDNGFNVTFQPVEGGEDITENFDIVVVATPLTEDKTDLKVVIDQSELSFPGSFQRTLAYIVHGELDPVYGDDQMFFIDKDDIIASISLLSPVDYNPDNDHLPHVYKIFSREELTDEHIKKYFPTVYEVKLIDWLAYPKYETFPGLDSFVLHRNLFYLNSIEWAASAMEMSALAARNVANLISTKTI